MSNEATSLWFKIRRSNMPGVGDTVKWNHRHTRSTLEFFNLA